MRSRTRTGRNENLESAIALLLQNQATFVSHLDEDRQRFTRIERDLELIKALLVKHEEILQKLPEAIRDKISSSNISNRRKDGSGARRRE